MAKHLHFYDLGPDRPWINRSLTNAAIVGHTTTDSVRLWVRAWEAGIYWLVYSEQPITEELALTKVTTAQAAGGNQPGLHRATFESASDFTHVFTLDGLKAGTEYYYCVLADADRKDRWELRPDPERRKFRTQPSPPQDMTFAVFSCHMPYAKNGDLVNIQMWDRLAEELQRHHADFAIGLGDQVYTDGNRKISIWQWLKSVKMQLLAEVETKEERVGIMRSWFRDIYRGYWGFRSMQRIMGQYPTYMIWDDHEIMDGWGSYTRAQLGDQLDTILEWENTDINVKLAYEMFEAARLTYHEYQHCHNPPTGKGVFDYAFDWGGCAFYVLDMRGHRDFTQAGNQKKDWILGKEQKQRFEKWIASLPKKKCQAVFVISPVPVVHLSNFVVNHLDLPLLGMADDLRDEWAHESNWKERDWLLDLVFKYSQESGKRVVFLSGDVHIGAAFRLAREKQPAARVYQLTSSAITHPIVPLLKLAIKDAGYMEGADDKSPYGRTTFRMLQPPFARNNFGMVSVRKGARSDPEIVWDLYGGTGEADEVVRLKELHLP